MSYGPRAWPAAPLNSFARIGHSIEAMPASKNKDIVTLGLVQMSASEDPEANLSKAEARIREGARIFARAKISDASTWLKLFRGRARSV
jgi:hypothetical protein